MIINSVGEMTSGSDQEVISTVYLYKTYGRF